MAAPRRRTTLALLAAIAGGAWVIAALDAGCSSPGPNPPNLQDCTLPGCLQIGGPPPTSFLAQGSTPPTEDAGIVDAEVIAADGSGIPAAGPGPGIVGSGTSVGANTTNELGPVCPITAPANGAPCAPIVNTIACIYSIETCFCTTDWICF
jgi:hypothetical protein